MANEARTVEILEKYQDEIAPLIMVLQDIQSEYGYLPKESLLLISDVLKAPMSQIFSVATFYKAFSLKPKGRHTIQLCLGTTCHVRGAKRILTVLEHKLGIKEDDTTDDLKFTLKTIRCMGACSLAPALRIDDNVYGRQVPERIAKLLEQYK
jgi:NADH:ubiquinone oxidoreductase subunit E